MHIKFHEAKAHLKRELVLVTALNLAVVSSFFHAPAPDCIDWDVLGVLFSLMLVVAGLKSVAFLDWLALRLLQSCTSFRGMTAILISITFLASMFVTNDVALITFVPIALILGNLIKRDMEKPLIFMTLAANLGSMLTPQGNPQNLFLFTHYAYTPWGFLTVMLPPTLLSIAYLGILTYRTKSFPITAGLPPMSQPNLPKTLLFLGLLLVNIGAVLHYVNKPWTIGITTLIIIMVNYRLLAKVDYSLLLTFIGFFIFIGNIQHTDLVLQLKNSFLGSITGTYIAALLTSQFISNVPAAMLLAGLTNQADALLTGVNVGGLGTLIASMASVITYKLFAAEHPSLSFTYLKTFSLYNFFGLAAIGFLTWLWLTF